MLLLCLGILLLRVEKMIELSLKQARKSSYKHRLGACITLGRKVLGVGYNKVNRYQSRVKTTSWDGSLHAEIAAVLDALRNHPVERLRGTTVTVVRIGKSGELRLAMPCKSCYNSLRNLGIKEVRFSNDVGSFTSMRF